MEKNRLPFTSSNTSKNKPNDDTKKGKGDYDSIQSSSHTQYFRKERPDYEYRRITSEEYLGISESLSTSLDPFRCVHGPEGKKYTKKGLLRKIEKELDSIPTDAKCEECTLKRDLDIIKTVEFLVTDPTVIHQHERLVSLVRDVAKLFAEGYKINYLNSLCTVLDYFVEAERHQPGFKDLLASLLINLENPILLNAASDIVTYFDQIRNFMGYLGYLLLRLEDDEFFDMVSRGIIYQLSAPDTVRTRAGAQLRHTLAAATPVLFDTTVRMLAVATPHRFPTYMNIALLLACESAENCMEMMKENIIENIFYRFSPYFPDSKLPDYENVTADPQDMNLKLGESSIHMNTIMSLLLLLLKTTNEFLNQNPDYQKSLPCPDYYSQRCFIWAYRYECLAREHTHERNTMTAITYGLLNCFGNRLQAFASLLMADVLALSVLTELPSRSDWTRSVHFNTAQSDVQFKKLLIYLSVDFIKIFPCNNYMIVSQHFLLGLMYLLDPGLCRLRARWSSALFAELRKSAFQALICIMPLAPHHLTKDYGMIRRLMWYIEWYSESPYEISVLYWCLRLLLVVTCQTETHTQMDSISDLFQTHGIIILIHLCNTLLKQKTPPVEKSQAIIALILRLLTSAVVCQQKLTCCVYPHIKWPLSVNSISNEMLDIVLHSLENHYIISDRWVISLLDFIWEAVIWNKEYRHTFVANNGIYKLLDLITMVSAPVQCVALAMVCDVARAGEAVGQLVSWRANLGASNAHPNLVKQGATIATLLAALFRDDCISNGIRLDEYGIIEDVENPLLSLTLKKAILDSDFREMKSCRTTVCLIAGDLAGSRMSKTFALLHMLSEDLEHRVTLADEAYNLYRNIKLAPEDEAVLVLCSHYLTVKLNEVWMETEVQSPGFQPQDDNILTEFLQIGKSWAKQIKIQQQEVIKDDRKKQRQEENSLYAFLGRVRLNIALDALREVRCIARSSDRERITHTLLQDAVRAHHRRTVSAKEMRAPVLRTYEPALDDQNTTGQNVKVHSILTKKKSMIGGDCSY